MVKRRGGSEEICPISEPGAFLFHHMCICNCGSEENKAGTVAPTPPITPGGRDYLQKIHFFLLLVLITHYSHENA